MEDKNKKRRRMAGLTLRAAARLMETSGPNLLLYAAATRQLGLDRLQELEIPPEVSPYRHLHLGSARREGGQDE